ncbi:MAG: hypothetical protein JNL30_04475 [Rubrivivax sp.]|nr:hypothetical protein [Rubrivivax sp.]
MKLLPTETCLSGRWLLKAGRVVADDVCARIDALVRGHLRELGRDASGWDALFLDPSDGRFWELTYPDSSLQGGGPPRLQCLSATQAREKYGGFDPALG